MRAGQNGKDGKLALVLAGGGLIRRVLESRSASYSRSKRDTPVGQLTRSLAELDLAMDRMMMQAADTPDIAPAAPEQA